MHRLLRSASLVAAAALASLLLPQVAEAGVTIKMATLAPEGTTWYKALRRMGDDWAQITDGEVTVKIYAGGVVGNETVMLRKMRINQLHAGAVTGLSLIEMDRGALALNTPLLIRDNGELDYVMEHLSSEFEQGVADNSEFRILNWGEVGWVRIFSSRPLVDPDDVGDLKMFVYEGDPHAVEAFRMTGFKPVVLAATDVLPSLQTGLCDAFPNTPLGALSMQWFALAPNMLDLPWSPMVGATIITDSAWEAIPAQYHQDLMASARKNGLETQAEVRRQDSKAIEVMQKYGLKVHEVDAAAEAKWRAKAESTWPIFREKVSDPETFDKVVKLLEEYRATH